MLGERIAAAMEMAGFESAEDLSQASSVPRRSITDYVAGKSLPNADYLARIARATLCNPAWLLTGEGDMRPQPDDPAAREEFAEARREMIAAAAQLISALAKLKALVPREEWAPLEQAMKVAAKAMAERK